MHALYDLKDMLVKQLEEYGKKGEMTAAVLERVDMLAHAAKNLDKVIECCEDEEYANRGYDGGHSMARGRTGNVKRDSMGRYASDGYSRNASVTEQLRDMMADVQDDRIRQELQRVVSRIENR